MIQYFESPIDIWINNNYDELMKRYYLQWCFSFETFRNERKSFQLQLKDKCDLKRITINKKRKWCCVMKNECKNLYHQTIKEEEPHGQGPTSHEEFKEKEVKN